MGFRPFRPSADHAGAWIRAFGEDWLRQHRDWLEGIQNGLESDRSDISGAGVGLAELVIRIHDIKVQLAADSDCRDELVVRDFLSLLDNLLGDIHDSSQSYGLSLARLIANRQRHGENSLRRNR